MDTTRWKSVLMPRDVYEELAVISKLEGRTISGQLRICWEHWKDNNLTSSDRQLVSDQVHRFKENSDEPLTSKNFVLTPPSRLTAPIQN